MEKKGPSCLDPSQSRLPRRPQHKVKSLHRPHIGTVAERHRQCARLSSLCSAGAARRAAGGGKDSGSLRFVRVAPEAEGIINDLDTMNGRGKRVFVYIVIRHRVMYHSQTQRQMQHQHGGHALGLP